MNIIDNYNELQRQILTICKQNNITYPINIVAVSKTFPAENIISVMQNTSQVAFGENYVQELYQKSQLLTSYPIEWHFIGNIQSNKIKNIANVASWIHSLSDIKHALKLNKERSQKLDKLNVLIEINISQDQNKHGLTLFSEILELAEIIKEQNNLTLRGLMGMSGAHSNDDEKSQQFKLLKQYFVELKNFYPENVDTLSMGMSDDFELAIKNGANMLRIGSKIFGQRK